MEDLQDTATRITLLFLLLSLLLAVAQWNRSNIVNYNRYEGKGWWTLGAVLLQAGIIFSIILTVSAMFMVQVVAIINALQGIQP